MARPARKGGNRSAAKTRKASSAKGRVRAKTKRPTPLKRSAAADIELREAREQQAATANILKVIARSPDDVQPVFEAIGESANKLVGAHGTTVLRIVGDMVELAAFTPVGKEADAVLQSSFPLPIAGNPHYEKLRRGEIAEAADTEAAHSVLRNIARARGYRSRLLVPLKDNSGVIGAISVTRKEPGAFAAHHVQLLQTFADQAVIAIQNVRLFNETKEALEQQTATADILKVIASSPSDTQPVFEAIVQSGLRLFPSAAIMVVLADDGIVKPAAIAEADPRLAKMLRRAFPVPLTRDYVHAVAILDKRVVEIPDAQIETGEFPVARRQFLSSGHRAITIMPMMRGDQSIGALSVVRQLPGPLPDRQLELLKTFADQAVIAIENTRLLKELHKRTDDLSESLQQQTATADVLKVISRSAFDLQTVLDTLVESATHLCQADHAWLFQRGDGDLLHFSSSFGHGTVQHQRIREFFLSREVHIDRGSIVGRSASEGRIVHVADVLSDPEYKWSEAQKIGGYRATLGAPLLRDGKVVGVIFVAKTKPEPFSANQIELLTTFADQAVIAIENARLFDEVQAKTRELEEALRYQTGSATILNVIASSPTNVQPVLKSIVESACDLCEAYDAVLVLKDGSELHVGAHHGEVPLNRTRWPSDRNTISGRAIVDQSPVHVHDIASERHQFPTAEEMSRRDGGRTVLGVPMIRDRMSVGAIVLRRTEVHPFSEKQINLLQTFADQAVIAIGNVRLFEELQARTSELAESLQQQTATSEVLQVISSSPGELEPVFETMLEKATRICGANFGTMYHYDGAFHLMASHNAPQALVEARTRTPVHLPPPDTGLGRMERTRQVVHIHDITTEPGYAVDHAYIAGSKLSGARTILLVPMLKDAELVGSINIFRKEVHPFADKQIELLSSFAKQAVIAIENARLLKELRQRTTDLSRSLDDLRAAQDRLVQTEKLASLGQLTAGIAHEIKNPLNFVNNFSTLSVELTDELNDLLKQAALAEQLRKEVDELTGLLKSNLEKVVQHGKRADSIVKNMLLHSREGSGELRAADINGLVEESLNLAYHGARAENSGCNITLQRQFDASAGEAELFPQEITRALLNLISNGFYAATKRKTENGEASFEPTLSATTKNLGASVEIRIRDNGTGIPPEVKEKMFNPFFTTKPAGEGTGLGLSMTHDIIVKQHGGTIRVDTEPGVFTEFIVTLPRATGVQNSQRGTR